MLFGAARQSQRRALVANAIFLLEVPANEVLLDVLMLFYLGVTLAAASIWKTRQLAPHADEPPSAVRRLRATLCKVAPSGEHITALSILHEAIPQGPAYRTSTPRVLPSSPFREARFQAKLVGMEHARL
jgi:hypothetical protein